MLENSGQFVPDNCELVITKLRFPSPNNFLLESKFKFSLARIESSITKQVTQEVFAEPAHTIMANLQILRRGKELLLG